MHFHTVPFSLGNEDVLETVNIISTVDINLPLTTPIANWFPQFKDQKLGKIGADGALTTVANKTPISIQDLMRHTSGLTYGGRGATPIHKEFPGGSVISAMQYDGKSVIDKIAAAPLLFEPGTTWDYGFGLDPLTNKPQSIAILTKPIQYECGGGCAYGTAGDYIRFGQMLLNGGSLDGKRVLGPQTVAFMTADHLGTQIKNRVAVTESSRAEYDFGLSVAVRQHRGVAAINGNVGDYTWNGAYGTMYFADPKENMVVVMMAATPGELRKEYRERVNALIYAALEK